MTQLPQETDGQGAPIGRHELKTENVMKFLTAGRAIFTLQSLKTGTHFTYQVRAWQPEPDKTLYLVDLLSGPDNTSDYRYLGLLQPEGGVKLTAKSKISAEAPSFKAIDWATKRLATGQAAPGLCVHHEGRCGRCATPDGSRIHRNRPGPGVCGQVTFS